ncbi:MAG TPA: VOC family protein [Acidobacteriaceae bacterium]|jgi:methylmalonyl-CoA/ethylmalonyl-CoA epimerase|nr:VOC family protein [Acidobacteriaceae bacterium]
MESNGGCVHLSEIGQIALTVGNLEESKAFYRDTLGIQFLFDAGTMAFFQCGSVRLLIGTDEQQVVTNGTILYFRVPDIQIASAALKAKGVVFMQEPHLVARMKSHDLWLAFVRDPAGNTLGLMAEMARAGEKETSA